MKVFFFLKLRVKAWNRVSEQVQTLGSHMLFGHCLSTNFTTACVQFQQQYIPPAWNKNACLLTSPQRCSSLLIDLCLLLNTALFSPHQAELRANLSPSAQPFSTNIGGFQACWFLSFTISRERVGETPSYPFIAKKRKDVNWRLGSERLGKINVRWSSVAGKS